MQNSAPRWAQCYEQKKWMIYCLVTRDYTRALSSRVPVYNDYNSFECYNKTVTRQSSSQRKSRCLCRKLHCLNLVFPAKNETLGPVCLGCEASLSMLKVPFMSDKTPHIFTWRKAFATKTTDHNYNTCWAREYKKVIALLALQRTFHPFSH